MLIKKEQTKNYKSVLKIIMILLCICLFLPPLTTVNAEKLSNGKAFNNQFSEKAVNDIMEKHVGKKIPGAALAIVKDGKILFSNEYGYADIKKNMPMKKDSIFEMASTSKLFTWTAVMQLVEEGKIDLDTDIRTYLPDGLLDLKFEQPVTMYHLMSHTGGFEEQVSGTSVYKKEDMISLEEYIGNQPEQVYPPGEIPAYSNYGTALAGYIVQYVSGVPFEEYIDTHIFKPLGIKSSAFHMPPQEIMEKKALGYEYKDNNNYEVFPKLYFSGTPAGTLNSSAIDMAKFLIAHMDTENHPLFKNLSTQEQMHRQHFTTHESMTGMAHGFFEGERNNRRIIFHDGNIDGFTTLAMMSPESHTGLVLLINSDSAPSEVSDELASYIFGEATEYNDDIKVYTGTTHYEEVAGTYRTSRMSHSNFCKIVPLLQKEFTKIENVNNEYLLVKTSNDNGVKYVEIEPYVFQKVDSDIINKDAQKRVFFVRDANENVIGVDMRDSFSTKVGFVDSKNFIALILTLSFILVLAGFLLSFKNKKSDRKHTFIMLGIFMGILINFVVLGTRFTSNSMQPLSNFNINIGIFYLLFLLCIGVALWGVKDLFHDKDKRKIKRLLPFILSFLGIFCLFIFLYQYNFFHFS